MKRLIAKNCNTYSIHNLPVGFWDKWKENKDVLKARGFSPFKTTDGWFLAVYDGGKATEEERQAFENKQFEDFKNCLVSELGDSYPDEVVEQVYTSKTRMEIVSVLDREVKDVYSALAEVDAFLFELSISEEEVII